MCCNSRGLVGYLGVHSRPSESLANLCKRLASASTVKGGALCSSPWSNLMLDTCPACAIAIPPTEPAGYTSALPYPIISGPLTRGWRAVTLNIPWAENRLLSPRQAEEGRGKQEVVISVFLLYSVWYISVLRVKTSQLEEKNLLWFHLGLQTD